MIQFRIYLLFDYLNLHQISNEIIFKIDHFEIKYIIRESNIIP